MKHRALSMLLALLMVVSLLPVAAIANGAEENTGAEEQEKTVEMGVNDSQQGGDGEKSQLPTEENEKTAIQLYVEKKGGATSYTRYQYDENVRLPWLVYVNESDNAVVPAFLTFFQSKAECYAIQKAADGTRTKFGQIEIHTNAEGLFALWKDFPKDLNWSEAEKADYVLMFHCNGRWYKFNAQLRAGSAPLVGELVLQYNGTNYSGEDGMILPAGVHQVALTLQTQNGRKMITSGENLEWDNTIITGLNPIDDNGLWRIVLAEPTGKQADTLNILRANVIQAALTSPVPVPMATKLQGKLLSRTQMNTQRSRTIWLRDSLGMEKSIISARRNIRKTSEM